MIRENRIVQAIERNPERMWRDIAAHVEGAAMLELHGLVAVSLPFPHPLFNSVLSARCEGVCEQAIDTATEFYGSRGKPWNWIVGPISHPTDLRERLLLRGFRHSHDTPGMALDLRGYVPEPMLSGAEVNDHTSFEIWLDTVARGFGLPHAATDPFRQLQARTGFSGGTRYFTVLEGGQATACSMSFRAAGVVGIYCVATLPEARRKGYGEQAMRAALSGAVDDGYDLAILHSSRMGVPLYEKLGFREYCKLSYFEPPPV